LSAPPPPAGGSRSIPEIVAAEGLARLAAQLEFERSVADVDWELDLDAGLLRFGARELSFQLLATTERATRTWLWSWANRRMELPEERLAAARRLRALGIERGVAELTSPMIELDRVGPDDLAFVAAAWTGLGPWYAAEHAAGEVWCLLETDPTVSSRRADVDAAADAAAVVVGAVERLTLVDPAATIATFLERSGFEVRHAGRRLSARLPGARDELVLRFDSRGRVARLERLSG